MCRFLMARFDAPGPPGPVVEGFSRMCRESRSPDGDRQEDGWGTAWFEPESGWSTRKSPLPIWEDDEGRQKIPPARTLILHARSASFPRHRGDIEFNQPFVKDGVAFVFNGLIRGVTFPRPLPGRIGSQKIWHLLRSLLRTRSAAEALARLNRILEKHSRDISALNLGLCDGERISAFSRASRNNGYYRLHQARRPGFILISSEPISHIPSTPVPFGRALTL